MKSVKFALYLFVVLFCFSSCATTINVKFQRPAKLDLNGAKTIAVLPIKPYQFKSSADVMVFVLEYVFLDYDKCNPDEKRCIDQLKYDIEEGLARSPYITLVHSAEVENAIKNHYTNPADVYFTGEVTDFYIKDNVHNVRIPVDHYTIDEEGNKIKRTEYQYVENFSRSVSLSLRYQIVDSYSAKVLATSSIDLYDSSIEYEHKRDLPSAYSILKYDLSNAANKILKELQPYTVTKSITLLKDKSKNPDMKNADKLASSNYLVESYNEFYRIYEETGLFEAGYNAAVLKEAMGMLSEAQNMMNDLYNKTKDKRAYDALIDINNEIYQANKLKNQIEEKDEILDF